MENDKNLSRDLLGNCEEGLGTLEFVNFHVVDEIFIYKLENRKYFSIDIIYSERCHTGSFVLSLLNGFECFERTEFSKSLVRLLTDKGFNENEVKKLLESGSSLTLSK